MKTMYMYRHILSWKYCVARYRHNNTQGRHASILLHTRGISERWVTANIALEFGRRATRTLCDARFAKPEVTPRHTIQRCKRRPRRTQSPALWGGNPKTSLRDLVAALGGCCRLQLLERTEHALERGTLNHEHGRVRGRRDRRRALVRRQECQLAKEVSLLETA